MEISTMLTRQACLNKVFTYLPTYLPFGLSGGVQITNTYFQQQPANQRRDSDCMFTIFEILYCHLQNSFDESIVYYFRQQPANQRRDSDGLQYLKSDIVICKNSFDLRIQTVKEARSPSKRRCNYRAF
jgi:hypothetical protein